MSACWRRVSPCRRQPRPRQLVIRDMDGVIAARFSLVIVRRSRPCSAGRAFRQRLRQQGTPAAKFDDSADKRASAATAGQPTATPATAEACCGAACSRIRRALPLRPGLDCRLAVERADLHVIFGGSTSCAPAFAPQDARGWCARRAFPLPCSNSTIVTRSPRRQKIPCARCSRASSARWPRSCRPARHIPRGHPDANANERR